MTGTRFALPVLAALVAAAPADAGGFFTRKGKSDARVRQLADALRTDPDEKNRRAAVAELREADPRTQGDVIPALVGTLQRDPAEAVRADAAEALGSFKLVFPLAGVALEAAAESDPAPAVRDAAQQALWEYHLVGYRSTKGADGIAGQTPEPPLAKPGGVRRSVAVVPPPPTPVQPAGSFSPPPVVSFPTTLPTVTTAPSPPAYRPAAATVGGVPPAGVRVIFTAAPPLQLNVTTEPPLAEPLAVAPPPRVRVPVVPARGPTINGLSLPAPDLELPAVAAPPGQSG